MEKQARELEKKILFTEVWQLPVRISHWVMALSVFVLGVTGYLIGNPLFSEPTEASSTFAFGTVRFIHFLAAYVFTAAFILRFYWGFTGLPFSRWRNMLPLTRQRWWGIWREIVDLIWPRGPYRVFRGHTPLANLSYLAVYAAVLFSVVSGFTLYAQSQYTPFWRWVARWGLFLFGDNLNQVHFLHHLMLWFFAAFLIAHLYLVVYTVVVSRTTEVDTMISGKKFVLEEDISPHSMFQEKA